MIFCKVVYVILLVCIGKEFRVGKLYKTKHIYKVFLINNIYFDYYVMVQVY